MENKTVLITLTSDTAHPGFLKLKASLERFDWPHVVLETEWKGFGTKIIGVYEFLKSDPSITHFFFCDANDVVVLGTMEEALSKIESKEQMLFSAERGCFPLSYLAKYFYEQKGRYSYLNSGLYYTPAKKFIALVEFSTPQKSDEDQSYFSIHYLIEKGNEYYEPDFDMTLDFNCNVFQSYSFIEEGDFSYENGRVQNLITGTLPVFLHGNGRQDMTKVYELLGLNDKAAIVEGFSEEEKQFAMEGVELYQEQKEQPLEDLKNFWEDTPEYHKNLKTVFDTFVNGTPALKVHRDFVETQVFGFGERAFWWMWKIILDTLPENAKLLEIGVFRGATLSLWDILKPEAAITGVTPLSSAGGHWESDYFADIQRIHKEFNNGAMPNLIVGMSQDTDVIKGATTFGPYNCVYIDGSHTYEDALADLNNYAPMVEVGGYLVIDDANNNFQSPEGFFMGIQTVTDAKLEWLKTATDFEFIFSCVHISVFRKI